MTRACGKNAQLQTSQQTSAHTDAARDRRGGRGRRETVRVSFSAPELHPKVRRGHDEYGKSARAVISFLFWFFFWSPFCDQKRALLVFFFFFFFGEAAGPLSLVTRAREKKVKASATPYVSSVARRRCRDETASRVV